MPRIDKSNRETVLIDHNTDPLLPEGEWYEVLKVLSWRENGKIDMGQMLKVDAPNMFGGRQARSVGSVDKDRMNINFRMHEVELQTMMVYLVNWSWDDPINKETVLDLTTPTKELLMDVIGDLQRKQNAATILDDSETGKGSTPSPGDILDLPIANAEKYLTAPPSKK